ncbi:hypothetical protein WN48_04294 [Eufriesea mexicana]|uniref:Little elongation complex subunit 2 C-terminal domain-containing protein n=1 Tax=Eufriesea mexicana TaxID=516756 RepID=A0A310SDS2_9HYME|nr:hypothetical protein WN48_04294 [Eufriesea mexicana]
MVSRKLLSYGVEINDRHCPLEDLIDATFINGERLEKESVMHKIMTGNFVDPFKNIEEDYKNIELNLLKDIDPDIKEEINNDNEIIVKQKWDCEHEDTQKVKAYVPGIVKAIFKFPKKSKLDKEQQAMCLRVLLRFSESDKPKITKAQREELQNEDVNCQKLAEDNNVDLVISSSGLNCLVNNIGPTYPNSWILPIVIKKHNDKNVIYIDKPGPPVANTIPEKNTWVYKYILKYYFSSIKNSTLKNENIEEDNIFGDIHSEKLLKIEEEYENISTECNNEITSNVSEKNRNFEEISTQKNIGNNDNVSANEDTTNKSFETTEDRISYNLFSIGPQPTEQNNLMKNIKKYRILVRTKIHGFEILENKEKRLLILTPKLEHQPDLGAEAVTLEEALKQWISLIFRPHTFLARGGSKTFSQVLGESSASHKYKFLYYLSTPHLRQGLLESLTDEFTSRPRTLPCVLLPATYYSTTIKRIYQPVAP